MTHLFDNDEQFGRALALAYRRLNRREQTTEEMRRHLERRGTEPAVAGSVLTALVADGYLDDRRYARLFAEDRRRLDGWGSERIRRGLLARGITAEAADAALANLGDNEAARALEVLRQRFPVVPTDRRARDRALGVLLRKGFDPEAAGEALAAYGQGVNGI